MTIEPNEIKSVIQTQQPTYFHPCFQSYPLPNVSTVATSLISIIFSKVIFIRKPDVNNTPGFLIKIFKL